MTEWQLTALLRLSVRTTVKFKVLPKSESAFGVSHSHSNQRYFVEVQSDNSILLFLPHLSWCLQFIDRAFSSNVFCECTLLFNYGWNFIKWYISFSVWAIGATYNAAKSPHRCKRAHNLLLTMRPENMSKLIQILDVCLCCFSLASC